MKKFFLYILAVLILPFYPILKKAFRIGEKVRISEQVIVVINKGGKKKCIS